MTDVYVSDWVVKLSTGVYTSVWNAVGDGGMSLINIIVWFLPWMLAITVSIFVIRFLFKIAMMFLTGWKISLDWWPTKDNWTITDWSSYNTKRTITHYWSNWQKNWTVIVVDDSSRNRTMKKS